MKTKIIKIEADWKDIKNVSRTTVNKQYSEKEATENFKKAMLLAEHSPIRLINIRWKWIGIKSWIATHFSRHKFECFISTQRNDRTNINRDKSPQDTPVNMDNSANAQHLIDVCKKRLCHMSHDETRYLAEDLKMSLLISEKELSNVLVPNCIYRNGCPEFQTCNYFAHLLKTDPKCGSYNIQERYNAYNKIFISEFKNEVE